MGMKIDHFQDIEGVGWSEVVNGMLSDVRIEGNVTHKQPIDERSERASERRHDSGRMQSHGREDVPARRRRRGPRESQGKATV